MSEIVTKILTDCCKKFRKEERTEFIPSDEPPYEECVCKEGMGCKTPRPVEKESVDQSAADDHLDYLSDQW